MQDYLPKKKSTHINPSKPGDDRHRPQRSPEAGVGVKHPFSGGKSKQPAHASKIDKCPKTTNKVPSPSFLLDMVRLGAKKGQRDTHTG